MVREEPETIIAALRRHAMERPNAVALIHLGDGERETARLDYRSLDRRVRAFAARLQQHGLANAPVLIALPPGVSFAVALLGCMFAGAIAAPSPPLALSRGRDRFDAILRDLRPAAIVADAPRPAVPEMETGTAPLPLSPDAGEDADPDAWQQPAIMIAQLPSCSTPRAPPRHPKALSSRMARSPRTEP